MHEDDVLVFAPTALADQGDQTREPFAGINWIECEGFEVPRQSDCFNRGLVRDAVGWPGVACDDLNGSLDERDIERMGRFARQGNDIGVHALGFGIDVDPHNPRIWHGERCTDDKSGLRSGTTGAMEDGARGDTQPGCLGVDLGNCRRIADRTERI